MKKTLLSAASSIGIVTAALLFTGCGDSDSSSPSSTAGTQTGQFVKGKWKGISYTRSNGVSGTTGDNGTFTYNLGENVTFDFGLGQARWVSGSTAGNSTAPAAVAVTACENPSTGAGWTLTDAAKVAAVFGAYGVNETGMGSTSLSTFIAAVKGKVPTDFNISAQNSSALDTLVSVMGAVSGAPATVNKSYASTSYDAKVAEVATTLAAATAPTNYNLSIDNKVIVLSNGSKVVPTSKLSNTSFAVGSDNYTVLGKLTGGVGLLVNGNVSDVAKVVAYNISSPDSLSGKNISVSVDGKNRTYSFVTNTSYTLKVDGTSSVNGKYNITSDGLGLNLYPSDTTTGGANSTVTFEDAPTTSGAIAKIWEVVSNLSTTLKEVVYSVVSKVL